MSSENVWKHVGHIRRKIRVLWGSALTHRGVAERERRSDSDESTAQGHLFQARLCVFGNSLWPEMAFLWLYLKAVHTSGGESWVYCMTLHTICQCRTNICVVFAFLFFFSRSGRGVTIVPVDRPICFQQRGSIGLNLLCISSPFVATTLAVFTNHQLSCQINEPFYGLRCRGLTTGYTQTVMS